MVSREHLGSPLALVAIPPVPASPAELNWLERGGQGGAWTYRASALTCPRPSPAPSDEPGVHGPQTCRLWPIHQ